MAMDRQALSKGRSGRWTLLMWGGAALLLSLPFFAMLAQAPGVDWSAADFIVMGVLLAIACGIIELAVRRQSSLAYTIGVVAAVGGGFLVVWGNLAVGHEHSPYDLYFYGALVSGVAIAGITRFKPAGLMVATLVTAAALVIVLRFLMVHEADAQGGNLLVTTVASLMISSPFLFAAWLFRKAARA